uniref:eIF-4F 25 kDa subunit n=1 Tax=Daphnia sinensis TaxID=1820382 RepID=A0A4Y7NC58_9CRUS|nr:EOG090X0BMA [Daphnia sinensis]SVE90092.1 EOG090X0BMA [Daphnia sinensis]SVE90720.1 EOG090X0BMA [Daphnia sinensis]SVE91347.1 EOG090X0BMA [Daphnia sinensis]
MALNNNKFDALNNSEDSDDDETSFAEDRKKKDLALPPIQVPREEHPLQYTYCLWFSRRAPGKHAAPQSFDQNLRLVGRFASVEQFWSYYCHLIKPCELSGHSDFHLFKDGIKPMWEDDANRCGGKWIVRLRKGLASRCWENLILAMLGEQFMVGDEICGAVISIRFAVRRRLLACCYDFEQAEDFVSCLGDEDFNVSNWENLA